MKKLLTMVLLAAPALACAQPTHTIVTLWRSDCAPCRTELQQLPKLAKQHPDTQFVLMALDKLPEPPSNVPKNYTAQLAPNPDMIFISLDNTQHALPFSAALAADNQVCAKHTGLLSSDRVALWIKSC